MTTVEASPFFRPNEQTRRSSAGGTKRSKEPSTGSSSSSLPPAAAAAAAVEEEHKSTVLGCASNLINAIIGGGIIGLPYAIKCSGFVAGIFLIVLVALLTEKSLRLLVETAKHVHVPTYETLAEAAFGIWGFRFVASSMFIMSYGAMLSYLMIVKDTFSAILGIAVEDHAMKRAILVVVSLGVMVPLSSLRDIADLAKTSRLNVTFDILMVLLVLFVADIPTALPHFDITTSVVHYETIFIGLGVLSFAFVCQHSSFIIAGSLENPTQPRWSIVVKIAVFLTAFLAFIMGAGCYIAFGERTLGNILDNLPTTEDISSGADPTTVTLSNIARGLLGVSMLFVYPMESFVARHVCVVLLFQGRQAHEGDDTSVLNRRDRRISLTVALYLLAVIPAAAFDDLGSVLAITGAVAASCLSYIGPGAVYLAIHGGRFLELSYAFFGRRQGFLGSKAEVTQPISDATSIATEISRSSEEGKSEEVIPLYCESIRANVTVTYGQTDSWWTRQGKNLLWFVFGMPLWTYLAEWGKQRLTQHVTDLAMKSPHPIRIGNVRFARAKLLQGGRSHVIMLHNKNNSTPHAEVDDDEDNFGHLATKLLRSDSLPKDYGAQRTSNGRIVSLSGLIPPHLGTKDGTKASIGVANNQDDQEKGSAGSSYQSIDQHIGAMARRQKAEEELALEDDPQTVPPTVEDFVLAIFYIVFGVIALVAGLASIFVQ